MRRTPKKKTSPPIDAAGSRKSVGRRAAKIDNPKIARQPPSDKPPANIVVLRFPALVEPEWKADDRIWFWLHQDRDHRLRRTFDGELEAEQIDAARDYPLGEGEEWLTLVGRVGPKLRARRMLRAPSIEIPELIPELENDEHQLRALADEFFDEKCGDRNIDFERAMRRAAMYAAMRRGGD
jgi:hypothetical protein